MRGASVGRYAGELLRAHHRVLEEAAGAAGLLGVGKLAAAYLDHRVAQVARRQVGPVAEGFAQALVVELRSGLAAEPEEHARDHVAAAVLSFLEHRAAVAVAALRRLEAAFLPLLEVEAHHSGDDVLHLRAVGPDVLHCGGADLSGYQRKVLGAPEAVAAGLCHEAVEVHSCAHYHGHLVEPHVHVLDVFDIGVQHRAGEVSGEQQVAALAHVEQGPGEAVEVQTLELGHVLIFDETRTGYLHPERVHRT